MGRTNDRYNYSENDQPKDIINNSRGEDGPTFLCLDFAKIFQDPGGYTNTRRTECGAEKYIDPKGEMREEYANRGETEQKRCNHPDDGHHESRLPYCHQLRNGALDPDLKHEQDYPQLREGGQARIGSQRLKKTKP